jgi:hypothetical protein
MPLRLLLLAAAGSWALAGQAGSVRTSPPVRMHWGGVMVSGGYLRGYAWYPGPWGYSPYSYYDPMLWTPFYHAGYYTGFAYGPGLGNVKLQAGGKTATVYVDGALAGRREQLKDMWLEPGVYYLEVRDGPRRLTQKIYVLSGKTLRITAAMMNQEPLP